MTDPVWKFGYDLTIDDDLRDVNGDLFTIKFMGDYVAETVYSINHVVKSNNIMYRSIQNSNSGHTPVSSPTYWDAWSVASTGFDISTLSAETTVDDADSTAFYDDSASTHKKITFANLWLWIKGKITSVFLPVGIVKMFDNAISDPNSLWGGTWVRIDGPAFPGMYKSGDTNMGTPMGTFGSNTKNLQHNHTLVTGFGYNTIAGLGSPIVNGTNNALSTTQDVLNAGITLCFWRRTE